MYFDRTSVPWRSPASRGGFPHPPAVTVFRFHRSIVGFFARAAVFSGHNTPMLTTEADSPRAPLLDRDVSRSRRAMMGTVATTCDERAGLLETRDDAGTRRPAVRVVLGFACAAILGIFGTALAAPGLLRLDATALGGAPAETAVNDDPLAENDLFHAAGVSFAASHAGRHPETALGRPSRRKGTSKRTNHHHRGRNHHDHHHHHQSKRSTKSLSGRELAATFMRAIKAKTLGPEDDGAIRRTLASETSGGSDGCLLYTSPSPRDGLLSRMPSSA